MTKYWWLYLTATLLALVAGCGAPSPQEEDTTGSAQLFGTTAQAITSADVTLVRVTVSAADMPARTAELVKTNNQWSGLIGKLPAGTGRTFSAEAFNSSGTRLYAGSATGVTILARQTTAVSITLQEVSPAAPFANAAPVITSLSAAPGTVEPGGSVTLTASASDANPGDTLTYAWSAPSGTFAQPSSLSTTWTAPSSAATVPLTLTVTDSKGLQGKVTFNVSVNSGKGDAAVNASLNTWPQVSNLSASATALEVNASTTVSATASDNDGDTLAYSWTASCAGTWTNATSATAQFTATALPGSNVCNNCDLTVTVTDSRNSQPIGGQTTGTLSICVGPKKTALFPPDITETFQSASSTSANGTVTFRMKAVLLLGLKHGHHRHTHHHHRLQRGGVDGSLLHANGCHPHHHRHRHQLLRPLGHYVLQGLRATGLCGQRLVVRRHHVRGPPLRHRHPALLRQGARLGGVQCQRRALLRGAV
jgi:uncharacterized protein (DUF2141 family)